MFQRINYLISIPEDAVDYLGENVGITVANLLSLEVD